MKKDIFKMAICERRLETDRKLYLTCTSTGFMDHVMRKYVCIYRSSSEESALTKSFEQNE